MADKKVILDAIIKLTSQGGLKVINQIQNAFKKMSKAQTDVNNKITSAAENTAKAQKKVSNLKPIQELKDELDDILEKSKKINKNKIKPKVDTSEISAAKETISRFSNTLASVLAATVAYTTKQSVEEIKDLIITQNELTNIYKDSSTSVLALSSNLQYLSGQSIPKLTDRVRDSIQYFTSEKEAVVGTYLATMVASTGIADFNVVLRNLGAASRGMLSPILSKFFGRQIGINFTDAKGNAISFGNAIKQIYEKYGQLNKAIINTPWWVFTQLKLQLFTTFRTLERPVIESFTNSLRGLISVWYKFNNQLDLSSKYIGTIAKLSIISKGMNITPSPKIKIAISDIQKKIDQLQKIEISDTNESIKKAKELREEIANRIDKLSKGNVSIRDFKDTLGNTLDISKMTSTQFQSIVDSITKAGGGLDILNIKLSKSEEASKNIKRLLTFGVGLSLPYMIGGLGKFVSVFPGASKLGSALAAPMKIVSRSFSKFAVILAIIIELFTVFKNNVDNVRGSVYSLSDSFKDIFSGAHIDLSGFNKVFEVIDKAFANFTKYFIYIGAIVTNLISIPMTFFNKAKLKKEVDNLIKYIELAGYDIIKAITLVYSNFIIKPISIFIVQPFSYLIRGIQALVPPTAKIIGLLIKELGLDIKDAILDMAKRIKKSFAVVGIRLQEGLEMIAHPKSIDKIKAEANAKIKGLNLGDSFKNIGPEIAKNSKMTNKQIQDIIKGVIPLSKIKDQVATDIVNFHDTLTGGAPLWLKEISDFFVERYGMTPEEYEKLKSGSNKTLDLFAGFFNKIKSLYKSNKLVYENPAKEAMSTIYNLLQSFYDKLASLTLSKNLLNIYNITKDISRFAPLVEKGLIKPIDLATLAFKELKSAASEALHATYYGIKENPLTKELKHIDQMTAKELNVKQVIQIILDNTKLQKGVMPAQDYASLAALVEQLKPYLIAAMQGKAGSQIFNFGLGTTTSP